MLYKLTAHEAIDLIKKKEVKCQEVVESVLERIKQVEDKVKSYITITEEQALENAKKIDEKIAKGEQVGSLYGLPIALKDNLCTDGIKTTCASKILYNFVPPYDATVVKKLKENNMTLLGKLNMDEFAMGSSTENSAFHTTRNPWDLERVPGGSSGGSAAAVAADEAFFTLGSDTGGSIRQPASLCGVVGMKPTYGRVSRFGLVAFASSLDQIGPLTKDVEDCALAMNIICGHDPYDATSAPIEVPDFTKALVNDVKGLKIGVPREYMEKGINDEVKKAIEKALELLKSLGADYEEFSIPIVEYALPTYYIIASSEASSNLARYDGIKYGYRTQNYEDLIDLYKKTRSEGFGAEVKRRIMLGTYALSAGYYDAYYKKGLQVRTLIKRAFDEAFQKYDVIITPTSPTTAFKIGERVSNPLEMYMSDICTVPVNIAGLPAISIPCGFDSNNLPIGLQIIGKAFDEQTILRVAYTYEQNSGYRNLKPQNL
ncbi:aspartyl/glutamyl-tRNA(Asn/Gln) amidotransferase subunit A [Caldicellulosiruptor bescii]|uniref:Glutamyl-tRNA(Gln) amidotransferase subunit A n=2 Tax=Caldicellulosiruptor bescii TaxID=31899 RepID=B9MQ84_CALBD|nr:Asp-tRNA(Asn)/Glu-tRNA(Gln) amidotransferase subunit GatA [Caldicellulosiruptor bescii]ACM59876.1 glutamyl-tRNA(Gln) amidotransferase, A subunit [Caldicellulosiruptor bescii DSM 6725]PBC87286.1 aspartyl/glutamyl-tRNA(Asn/Gln) amidotransferase subunit A [Caldicellulosiruptor bescii]PBC90226.1 aspartyl/glutamyl-tRNA(Asn/Gln) amidotransferase subunit A [Caldicellulosiruptor bescii]PBD04346.1 aspartyl/glutamyl-tRNA(Asn/Gln) amidotransferase subunit A [Caldicellulosiruptor bescii]PBD06023.1 aspa